MRKQKGFTLIELLVVIAIIGLLSTLAVVSLNSARQKARDAKRVADVKQVQTALELFNQEQNMYPATPATSGVLGATATACLNSTGFMATTGCTSPYMGLVPAAPAPADGDCTDTTNPYTYAKVSDTAYTISFCLGNTTGGLAAGAHTASEAGIQ